MKYFHDSLEIAQQIGDSWAISAGLTSLGGCARGKGDYAAAIAYYQRSIRIKERLGDRRGLVIVYMNLGEAHREAGEPAPAIEFLHQSLLLAQETQSTAALPEITRQLAACHLELGHLDEAEHDALEARKLSQAKKDRLEDALAGRVLGEVALRRGDLMSAVERLSESLANLRDLKSEHEIAVTLLILSEAVLDQKQSDEAGRYLDEAGLLLRRVGTSAERAAYEHLVKQLGSPTSVTAALGDVRTG